MKKQGVIRNLAVALGVFLFWGNLISFLLPTEQYGAVIKTIDFSTAVFLLAILLSAAARLRKGRRDPERNA